MRHVRAAVIRPRGKECGFGVFSVFGVLACNFVHVMVNPAVLVQEKLFVVRARTSLYEHSYELVHQLASRLRSTTVQYVQ